MDVGHVLWTFFLVFIWVAWIWLGVLYLIARGRGMNERRVAEAVAMRQAQDEYIRQVAADSGVAVQPGPADQLSMLADLRARGALTDEEFAAQKAKVLA